MSWRAIAALMLIAWGALAFGAVYPWAFIPLFTACAAVGVAMLWTRNRTGKTDTFMAVSLALLVFAICLQLVPLPIDTIRSISPETDLFLRRYAVGYGTSIDSHALSIQPRSTVVALAATVALATLFLGLTYALTRRDALHIARGVCTLGAIVALAGIVQKALWNGRIYGFWRPLEAGDSFGPFVNRNHFAGWMLMALPVAIGYFCGRIARGLPDAKPGRRNAVVWLSSGDASETILTGFATLLMALALMLTMSRSGIMGLFVALLISGWFVARRQAAGSRRAVVGAYLVFVALFVIWWTGLDRLAARFAETGPAGVAGRLGIWADTWRIVGRFPAVGTGLNTYGAATVFYQTVDLSWHFAEAHNDYLQLMAEGGLLLCLPIALVLLAWVRTANRRFRDASTDSDYWIRIGAVTGILAIALQETVDFSLQMPGNATLFVLLLALAARRSSRAGTESARLTPPAA